MAEKKEITKVDIPLKIGDSAVFEKTITETDVVLFGGLTGDYSQMHFNEEYMKKTMYGTRIAHGILTFAIGCTASTKIQEQVKSPVPSASYGYDKLRFFRHISVTASECLGQIAGMGKHSYKIAMEAFKQMIEEGQL